MIFNRKLTALTLVLGLSLMAGGAVSAQSQRLLDQPTEDYSLSENFNGTRLNFNTDSSLSNFTLRVSGPDGYHGQVFSARSAPSFRLGDHGSVPDGLYSYEMTAATPQLMRQASMPVPGADGRSAHARPGNVGTSMTGSFRVVNGQILILDSSASER